MSTVFWASKGDNNNMTDPDPDFVVTSRAEVNLGCLVGLDPSYLCGEVAQGVVGELRGCGWHHPIIDGLERLHVHIGRSRPPKRQLEATTRS